ncbi:hypothetical protein C8Q80DRAFT_1123400 [Daedaleopsis nitida]|nr:hypothetical protein C8Q80DRAFT_1123400 [Daedaleopsis nitida]
MYLGVANLELQQLSVDMQALSIVVQLKRDREKYRVEIDEVVLRLQGYMVEGKLPPIRQHHISHNPNCLISLQESVTLTGLGCQSFDLAVQAIKAIHQRSARHVSGL